jgi:hypothetical protein
MCGRPILHLGYLRARRIHVVSPGNLSRRQFVGMASGVFVLPATILRAQPKQTFDLQRVCDRMVEMDNRRFSTLLSYSATRRYSLRCGGSGNCAELLVRIEYSYPGHKTFQVISD